MLWTMQEGSAFAKYIQTCDPLVQEVLNACLDISPEQPQTKRTRGKTQNTIHVSNIPFRMSEHTLHHFFSQAGDIVHCRIIMDRKTQLPRGFGFVEFSSPEEAKKALDLNGTKLDGRPLAVKLATPKSKAN